MKLQTRLACLIAVAGLAPGCSGSIDPGNASGDGSIDGSATNPDAGGPLSFTVGKLGTGFVLLKGVWSSGSDVWIVGDGTGVIDQGNGTTGPFSVILHSADSGGGFTPTNLPTGISFVKSIWGDDVALYVGSGHGLLRSVDHGTTWTQFLAASTVWSISGIGADVFSIAIDPFHSPDHGATWLHDNVPTLASLGHYFVGQAIWARSAADVFAGGTDLLHSSDGTTFTLEDGLSGLKVNAITGAPQAGGTVIAVGRSSSMTSAVILRRAAGGTSWTQLATPAGFSELTSVTMLGSDWYAAGTMNNAAGMLRSTDDGQTWTPVALPAELFAAGIDASRITAMWSAASAIWVVGIYQPHQANGSFVQDGFVLHSTGAIH